MPDLPQRIVAFGTYSCADATGLSKATRHTFTRSRRRKGTKINARYWAAIGTASDGASKNWRHLCERAESLMPDPLIIGGSRVAWAAAIVLGCILLYGMLVGAGLLLKG